MWRIDADILVNHFPYNLPSLPKGASFPSFIYDGVVVHFSNCQETYAFYSLLWFFVKVRRDLTVDIKDPLPKETVVIKDWGKENPSAIFTSVKKRKVMISLTSMRIKLS